MGGEGPHPFHIGTLKLEEPDHNGCQRAPDAWRRKGSWVIRVNGAHYPVQLYRASWIYHFPEIEIPKGYIATFGCGHEGCAAGPHLFVTPKRHFVSARAAAARGDIPRGINHEVGYYHQEWGWQGED